MPAVAAPPCRPRGITLTAPTETCLLAKPNYSFEKRQRELAKKKQQDEKDARKRQAREAEKAAADAESKTLPDEN